MRLRSPAALHGNKGTALIEFTVILPFLLLLIIGMVDLCILIDQQLRLIHLGREAASVLLRGADFNQAFGAIATADGALDLDGNSGLIILTRIALDPDGNPIIIEQQSRGGLSEPSAIGTLPSNSTAAPATVPNGRTVPPNMGVVVVELFTSQPHFLTGSGLGFGSGAIILNTLAAF